VGIEFVDKNSHRYPIAELASVTDTKYHFFFRRLVEPKL